ncbi:MAG: beta-galactosidase, partial [Bacteroides sp.]
PHYYMLRKLHLFMHDYGEILAPMEAYFPCEQDIPKGDDSYLRWSYRAQDNSAFIFINNYERLQNLTAKHRVQLEVCGVKLPRLTIPAGTMCIFPVNIDGIKYTTAQIIAKRDGNIYLEQIKGIPTTIAIDGKVLRNVKARGTAKPIYKNIYLLTSEEAERLFLDIQEREVTETPVIWQKVKQPTELRTITIGIAKVAEEPTDADFQQAVVYTIDLPADSSLFHSSILTIYYRGDVARLYADGKLLDDNFYNGRPFQFALWRLPEGCRRLELRILPLQKNMPVYFPREADTMPGECVNKVVVQGTD